MLTNTAFQRRFVALGCSRGRSGAGFSRVALNAELSAAGETRIIVPTGFRDEYISSLRAASHNDRFQAMVSVLAFARRWTARMDFSSREVAEPLFERTNALLEPAEAVRLGLRLTMP